MHTKMNQQGFTLIEIAIVLLVVGILLGYTVALFPKQQELKQYRAADKEMDQVIAAIIGFAQVNGRLPCPAIPNSGGLENGGGAANCNNYGGFVPVNTLGIEGRLNGDNLLLDPWGSPYRYYVSASDAGTNGIVDFVRSNEIAAVGLVDAIDVVGGGGIGQDQYIDLDGQFVICDAASLPADDSCDGANEVFGRPPIGGGPPYAGAPFVLISHGKNWAEGAAGDELENMGNTLTTAFATPIPNGPMGKAYLLKNVAAVPAQTTFVKRITGAGDNFDDIVKWVSPNILFSKMIEAGQLP